MTIARVPFPGQPDISVVIPARNEVGDLRACLVALSEQKIEQGAFEVIVIDGDSDDGTGALADATMDSLGLSGVVITNTAQTTPSSLNLGLAVAEGRIVCRVDARSVVPPNYLSRCRDLLDTDPTIAVVGGAQVPRVDQNQPVARAIGRALSNRYTTGLARYRRGAASGPSDTVYLGAFRRDELCNAGGWNERFETNQDFELNQRMAAQGTVWFDASIPVTYTPRPSMAALIQQYRRFGRWKAAIWVETDQLPSTRHMVLLAAPPVAAAVGWLLLRRSPGLAAAMTIAAVIAIDHGAADDAPALERGIAVGASLATSGVWWFGVVEQLARAAKGERLLPPEPIQSLVAARR